MANMQMPFNPGRTFQVWSYHVSHSVLLLRSNRDSGSHTRMDMMFRGVTELQVRSKMKDLVVGLAGPESAADGGRFKFSLDVGDWHGYVVARGLYFSEDDLAYGEPSTIDDRELYAHVVRAGMWE
ncbi:hypothetical protein ACFVDI_21090 [Nocardioides sp. NPDC057767]|uniref:hypothetical protein n=1 Tax=unclassified Nocardioides TaxID=2615069 RepID=UPI003673213C